MVPSGSVEHSSGCLVQAHEYATAWEAAIVNRVDLNCLVDFQWPTFLDHAHEFVQQVAMCSFLAQHLCTLPVDDFPIMMGHGAILDLSVSNCEVQTVTRLSIAVFSMSVR